MCNGMVVINDIPKGVIVVVAPENNTRTQKTILTTFRET